MTTETTITTNDAGTFPAPREAHQRAVKFNKFNVTNGLEKARVFYSLDNRTDGRRCVMLYAKDYSRALGRIFGAEYLNETDSQTDYFDEGRVVLFEEHTHYLAARQRAEAIKAELK